MRRFDQFCKNLASLEKAYAQDLENEFIISGIIDKFFLQFELGWKTLKEALQYEGTAVAKTGSPRQIIKEAYQYMDFMEEDTWLRMLSMRNDLAHMYDAEAAKRLTRLILTEYIPAFQNMRTALMERYGDVL